MNPTQFPFRVNGTTYTVQVNEMGAGSILWNEKLECRFTVTPAGWKLTHTPGHTVKMTERLSKLVERAELESSLGH